MQRALLIPCLVLALLATPGCNKDVADSGGASPEHGRGASREGGGHPGGEAGKAPEGDRASSDRRQGGPPGGRQGGGDRRSGGGSWGGGPPGGFGEPEAAVPVEVTPVARRSISSFLETNGTLEAENDVELVARTSGPIVELLVEEGDRMRAGDLLARIDPAESRARMEISRLNLAERKIAYERAKELFESALLSQEAYDQALSAYESAQAQFEGDQILFSYTEVKAPFTGTIVTRHVKLAQTVSNNQALFRITDFDPLLCPIQVPERELPRLKVDQPAYVEVEAWPERRFQARVLRISPVVDAATGTVKVTLEVSVDGKLRPGMFAGVYLETEKRPDALVIPRTALSLESIGDTVYVAIGDKAARREVELGFQEGDAVEIVRGLEEGENVIVIGQDGLSDGTPIQVLAVTGGAAPAFSGGPPAGGGRPGGWRTGPPGGEGAPAFTGRGGPGAGPPDGPPGGGRPGGFGRGGGRGFDPSNMTPEQLERIKERMRSRGMTDEQIEERLKSMRERSGGGGGR